MSTFKGRSDMLKASFMLKLPAQEDTVFDLLNPTEKAQHKALTRNAKMMTICITGQDSDKIINAVGLSQTPGFSSVSMYV